MAKQKEKIIPVTALVKELKIPHPFLRKILQVLHKKGLLKSYKGLGGGFQLAIVPKGIFLTDLIEAFQGPLKLNECLFKKRLCPDRSICLLKQRIDAIERRIFSELSSISLASLM